MRRVRQHAARDCMALAPPRWVGRKTTPAGVSVASCNGHTRSIQHTSQHKEVHMVFKVEKITDDTGQVWIQDPPIARFLFQSTAVMAWTWLVVRLYVGYDFLIAGWHKFTTSAWMDGSGSGIS